MARRSRWAEEWTSYEAYIAEEANLLKEPHPFVLDHTLETRLESTRRGDDLLVVTRGAIYCRHGVVVEVSLYAETRRRARAASREIRPISVLYEAYVSGREDSTILRYDDHGREDWHVHVLDDQGVLTREAIDRGDIPSLREFVDQLALLFE